MGGMATFSNGKVFSRPSKSWTIRPCYSKALFSCLSKSRARCYSGISSPPPPRVDVEELENKHGFGPWLMFADAENDKRGGEGLRRCYSFASGEIFSLPAPHLQGRRCWGTQYGWLITYVPSNGGVHLFNPLTHHQLPLPSKHTLPSSPTVSDDAFFDNFALSSNPSDSDRALVVMSMYGKARQLAFSSPGDEAWNYLNQNSRTMTNFSTIFYRGQFYSIDRKGKLKVACDITSDKPEEKVIATFKCATKRRDDGMFGLYLVDISGHLHLLWRRDNVYTRPVRKRFDIYRFDFQETKWIRLKDLDGHALFVGNNTTFAISASDYPGIKPGCIYFADDMGVYDLATQAIVDPLVKGDNVSYSRPLFVIPSLSNL